MNRPVVLVKDKRTVNIPFDLGTINVFTYDESLATWKLDEEIDRLMEHARSVPTDESSGNAMWRYFGLTKRGGPTDEGSLDAKVELLLAEITKLRLESRPPVVEVTSVPANIDRRGADLIRLKWDDIIELMKSVRRVGWMMLRNAKLESVDRDTLTLRFGRDGDAKGFIVSGCDSDLEQVLGEIFDMGKVRIIAKGPTETYQSDR